MGKLIASLLIAWTWPTPPSMAEDKEATFGLPKKFFDSITPPDERVVRKWIVQLESDDFSEREEAIERLKKFGIALVKSPTFQKSIHSEDADVQWRAQRILEHIFKPYTPLDEEVFLKYVLSLIREGPQTKRAQAVLQKLLISMKPQQMTWMVKQADLLLQLDGSIDESRREKDLETAEKLYEEFQKEFTNYISEFESIANASGYLIREKPHREDRSDKFKRPLEIYYTLSNGRKERYLFLLSTDKVDGIFGASYLFDSVLTRSGVRPIAAGEPYFTVDESIENAFPNRALPIKDILPTTLKENILQKTSLSVMLRTNPLSRTFHIALDINKPTITRTLYGERFSDTLARTYFRREARIHQKLKHLVDQDLPFIETTKESMIPKEN